MATPAPAPLRIKGVIECELCYDTGFRQLANDRDRAVVRCECVQSARARRLLDEANIPHRYRAATLSSFDCSGPRAGLAFAHLWARRFVESYPVEGERGALLVGNCGTGKTHLAIGILKELVSTKGVAGRFCDYSSLLADLLQEIRSEGGSEMEVLRPLLDVAVLILDDIGAIRPSAWVLDTVTMLLNVRYSRGLTTLVTANYRDKLTTSGNPETTLQERVGERVVSRLREMCRFVTMDGPDYRMKFGG